MTIYIGLIEKEEKPKPIPKKMVPGVRLSPADVEEVQQKIAELAREYNISIGGCGCCGSPWFEYINLEGIPMTENSYSVGNAAIMKECGGA